MRGRRLRLPSALVAAVLLATARGEDRPERPRSLDHARLLAYLGPDGSERPVRTVEDWQARRAHVLRGMEEVMGPPRRPEPGRPLDQRVEDETRLERFVRKRITFDSGGDRVPAFLLLPIGVKGKSPAVLCLHQTTSIGKAEPAGLGGLESLHYAADLAARGYVTLAPDYPNFGDHRFDVYGNGYRSGTMKAIDDNRRALDLLQSLPEVDGARIGCMGHSLGGHNALFTAAFDERIRVIVSNCGFTAFGRYYGGDLTGWSSKTYMPRIPSYGGWRNMPFDFHEVVGALAPRPFLALAPLHDSNFDVDGVREVVRSAREVYDLFRSGARLEALHPDCAHAFPEASREKAYGFLDRWLKDPPGARQ